MPSDEPYNHPYTSNGLTSPFEYVPRPSADYTNDRDAEPDDFYRAFAPERTSQPDTGLLHGEDGHGHGHGHGHGNGMMAAPSKRKQTNINGNGTATKPSTSAAAIRNANRSISDPASAQSSASNAAMAAPVLATASRARNNLVKERLKQFDGQEPNASEGASRYGRPRTPSGSNPSSTPFQSPSQELRHAKNGTHASPRSRAGSGTQTRRPLFGEVLDNKSIEEAGYGIARVDDVQSPGLMQLPVTVFPRNSRSHSELEAGPYLNIDSAPASNHHRSHSDETESRSPTISPSSGRASPALLSTHSRIPVRARRASDIGTFKQSSRQPWASSPLSTSQKSSSSRNTPNSSSPQPMTLSSRRYSPPKRLHEHSQHLTAMVQAPPPKTSPPLRSTRTRQPVTQASTNSSRSRVSDRFKPPTDSTTSQSRPKPSIPGQIDIAARRARLQKNLQGGTPPPKAPRQDLNVIKKKVSGKLRSGSAKHEAPNSGARGSGDSQTTTIPRLSVEITVSDGQRMSSQSLLKEAEFEESPVLPRDVLETLPNAAYAPPTRDPVEAPPQPQPEGREGTQEQAGTLLKHVMSIRQSDPSLVSAPVRTQGPDDFLSEFDDGETIQILLGATPKLPQNSWQRGEQQHDSPEAFHTPQQGGDESEGDMFDGRSSIYPDDSVSVVFQKKFIEEYMAKHPPPPLPSDYVPNPPTTNGATQDTKQNYTLDSDARSQINRVLDQYQEGHVTPEMAHGFQREVETLTPQMARHGAWESPEATKTYLQLLLNIDDDGPPTPPATQPAPTPEAQKVPQPLKPEPPATLDMDDDSSEASGGIAIIYAPTYGRNSSDSHERSQALHSHTASTSTLRPTREDDETSSQPSNSDDPVFRPDPPPKDVAIQGRTSAQWSTETSATSTRLSDIVTSSEGLGLSLDSANTDNPPKSPRPPVPNHAPPPPPPSPRRESLFSIISQIDTPVSPGPQGKKKYEVLSAGLPESPAPRGRGRRSEAVDSGYQKGSDSGKQSLEINTDVPRSSSSGPAATIVIDKREKDLNDRRNRIKELVDTEHSFHQDMTILMDIYMATSSSVLHDEDRRVLFGNLEQVRNFTTDFLDALKGAGSSVYTIPRENRWNYKRGSFGTSHSGNTESSSQTSSASIEDRTANDKNTTVGQVFCENLARIEKVYGDWLKGHTAANKRLVELQKQPAVKYWLEECHDNAKDITAAWSLDSLIIKPAQRLLKYPLLLADLLKTTPEDHPDHPALKQALEQMKAAAGRINDLKRRAELVEEAMSKRRESDSKMKVGKLLNRRTEKLKQQVGLSNLADDQEYETVAQKFGGHFFQLQVVMRDVEKYLEDSQLYIDHFGSYIGATLANIQTDQERHPEKESNWLRFATTLSEIAEVALPEHVKDVRRTVIEPIQQLWRLHVGPQKMMAKRKKRLVEYVRHKTMVEKGEKPDKKLDQDAELFKAVNETLKEELPKLYTLTKKLVEACLLNFIELQAEWQYTWQRKLEPFVEKREDLLEMALPEFICHVQLDFNADLQETEDRFNNFRICNGATLAEAQTFLSPATTFTKDDDSSTKRPSTLSSTKRVHSLTSEQASLSTPNFGSRNSDNMGLSPLVGSFPMPDGLYTPNNIRGRAGSAMSSGGPPTPHSFSNWPGPSTYVPGGRPITSYEQNNLPSPGIPRLSHDAYSPARVEQEHQPQFAYAEPAMPSMPGSFSPEERFSGMFHSALPLSDSPRAQSPEPADGDAKIIFLAASLFEFHIDGARKEAGYPYLTYQPGEIFDVIGQKGELWLAKNQDDSSKTIGWIWEKHFARILPEN